MTGEENIAQCADAGMGIGAAIFVDGQLYFGRAGGAGARLSAATWLCSGASVNKIRKRGMLSAMKLSRRQFIGSMVAAGLAAGTGRQVGPLLASEPHWQFPSRSQQRLALTSWPFRDYMESRTKPTGMDIVAFAKMAIERFHIYNINPLIAHFRSEEASYLEQVREGVTRAGSHFVDLGLGGGNFFGPDASRRALAVAQGKKGIADAVVLGSPSVRQHLSGGHNAKPDVALAASSLGQLAEYAAKKNVVVNLENDSLINEDPFFIVRVIEKVGNPYLRALPDFGNTLLKGDPAYNYRGLRVMFQHAFNMSHVKDEVVSTTGKVFKVDLAEVFGIAKASGYRGYFSMEWETQAGDVFEGTRRLVSETLKYLS